MGEFHHSARGAGQIEGEGATCGEDLHHVSRPEMSFTSGLRTLPTGPSARSPPEARPVGLVLPDAVGKRGVIQIHHALE